MIDLRLLATLLAVGILTPAVDLRETAARARPLVLARHLAQTAPRTRLGALALALREAAARALLLPPARRRVQTAALAFSRPSLWSNAKPPRVTVS